MSAIRLANWSVTATTISTGVPATRKKFYTLSVALSNIAIKTAKISWFHLVYNLKRAINILGVPRLIQALV